MADNMELKTQARKEKDPAVIAKAKNLDHVPWCEDYEKCISGMLYNPGVPELIESRFRAKRLCHKYNNFFPDDITLESLTQEREKIVRDLFGHVGKEPWLEPPIYVDMGCNVSVGDKFYANYNLTILDCGLVTIGDRVMIGPNVQICAASHDIEVRPRQLGLEYCEEIVIGDDAWIGTGVIILAGVHIGEGTTIGAGSVVTKDIPPWSVAVGCPAKVVKTVEPVVWKPEDGVEGSSPNPGALRPAHPEGI